MKISLAGRVILKKARYIDSVINKSVFLGTEIVRSSFARKPRMRILLSAMEDWEKPIRRGFAGSGHRLSFGAFTRDNIREADLLVPITIPDLKALSRHPQAVKDNLIPIPSLEAINTCDDKFLFYQRMVQKGFGKYLPKIGNNLPFPYILKKSISGYGVGCYMITDKKNEEQHGHLIGAPGYFCQQVIAGKKEYATHVIFKDGRIVTSLNIQYGFDDSLPIKGQQTPAYRRISRCPHLELFAEMLRAIEFEGLCCINYKEVGKHPYVLEINPRFGGSLSSFFFYFVRRLR